MGTPCHAIGHRSDNKLYRILTPQSAMVRPHMYDYYDMDEYPTGTNAVVAVISYTVSTSNKVKSIKFLFVTPLLSKFVVVLPMSTSWASMLVLFQSWAVPV